MKGIFKSCIICFVLLLPAQIANSCAWYYDDDDIIISPFDQTLANTPQFNPFYYSAHYYNGYSWDNYDEELNNQFDPEVALLNDWMQHFDNKYTSAELENILFEMTDHDFDLLKSAIEKNNKPSGDPASNTLRGDWKSGKYREEFDYLIFAKKAEPYVQPSYSWEPEPRDTLPMRELEADALKYARKSNNIFIRQRFIYQAMRMAHYTGDYSGCLNIYDNFATDTSDGSLMSYWCISLRAGAYWRMKKYAESSYYNAIVFDKCPSRRLYAERDFWIDDESTWQRCLAMCKNDHERNVLWLLTGINQDNSAIPAMEAILKTEPSSPELELLLAREIEKIQRNNLPDRSDSNFTAQIDMLYKVDKERNDLEEVKIFIQKGIATNSIRTPSFWYSAEAYLSWIQKKYDQTIQYAEKAKATANSDVGLYNQAVILEAIATSSSLVTITSADEMKVFEQIKKLPFESQDDDHYLEPTDNTDDAYRMIMFDLYVLYNKENNFAKAEICRSEYLDEYDMYANPQRETLLQLLAYFREKDNNAFDTFLKREFKFSADDLLEILGTLELRNDNIPGAISYYEQIDGPDDLGMMQLPTDPFMAHTWDCHDCDFELFPADYNKLSLAQKILELETKLKSDPSDKAIICNMLGNAFYNMTHFGNSWMAKDYYLCAGCDGEYGNWSIDNYEDYDCSKAAEYYKLAYEYSGDEEFKAMNLFMMGKCEQNDYYLSSDYSYENENGKKDNYRNSFLLLKSKYQSTEFYKQAIDECKYFNYYVSKH